MVHHRGTEGAERDARIQPGRSAQDQLTGEIIGAAIEVHRALGPGLLESAYESCLAQELGLRGLGVERQREVRLEYKGEVLDCVYRLDLVVERQVLIEIKAVEKLLPIHEAQVLTYLRLTGLRRSLLLNFNTAHLRDGIKRISL